MDKNTQLIYACWNAGLSLRQAYLQFNRRGGKMDKPLFITQWKILRKKQQHKCLELQKLEAYRMKPPTREELDVVVQPGMTYGDWLGVTGPGKQLREILVDEALAR